MVSPSPRRSASSRCPRQAVTLRKTPGSDTRIANIGDKLFAAMKLKMLLDNKSRLTTFYGDCR